MSKRKTHAPLIILFLIAAIVAILWGGNWILSTSRLQMLRETEQNLKTAATQQVSLVTIWYGSLINQMHLFVDVDMLRLFASEIDSANISDENLRFFVQPDKNFEKKQEIDEKMRSFIPRIPGLQQMLNDFVDKNDFESAAVLSRTGIPYLLSQDFRLKEEHLDQIVKVVEKGTFTVLPVRKVNKKLVVDVVLPIFAPKYIDQKGKRVVALFVCTCDVQKVISAVDQTDGEGFFTSAVLESVDEGIHLIDPVVPGGQRELSGDWECTEKGLPFSIRQTPTRAEKLQAAYTLGLPITDLPWFVLQSVKVEIAEASYVRFRKNVYIGCVLLIALTCILLAALWWWIVGRRERAIADQMRSLYMIANEQKQILDGVNTALSAGVVLNDLSGEIYYVNQRYAEMAHMDAEKMNGMSYMQLPYEMARSLVNHTLAINENPEMINFTEILPIGDSLRHYLTACTPFTDEKNCLVGMVSVYSDITELVEAQNRAQRMVTQTVEVFVRAIEAVDPYLCGQSSSTAQLAVVLAQLLEKNDEETLATLRTAASLSQIGMIQLPSALLLKTGALTQDERAQMQQHVEYARAALQGVDFGLPVLEAITQMYERLDGSGYPRHLKGEQICFNARILAVANTFCALMRPRSYRTAHTTNSALSILEAEPKKYDLTVTQALRGYLESAEGKAFLKNLIEHKIENIPNL
ncbi:MAG: PAS domain-containing protein [Desulfovibrio sp.]|nr:PAS domain-containing protein [Desulfovibrio sp.]